MGLSTNTICTNMQLHQELELLLLSRSTQVQAEPQMQNLPGH